MPMVKSAKGEPKQVRSLWLKHPARGSRGLAIAQQTVVAAQRVFLSGSLLCHFLFAQE